MADNQKKLNLFRVFSNNLNWVKEHPDIKFNPDFNNGYLCPLCMDVFLEEDLSDKSLNSLTFEDIPPASLGGKPRALTCKTCNSKGGHDLDVHLLNRLKESDFMRFSPNTKTNIQFKLNNNKVNGEVEIDSKGVFHLKMQEHRSDPKQAKQFTKDLTANGTFGDFKTPNFTMTQRIKSNERRAEIALLRTAYLLAFSTFGNGFLINHGLYKVREQILNPDKEIIPGVFWINYDFPDEYLGLNMITRPADLCCFLAVFNLETTSGKRKCAIALPGPSSPGIKIFENIKEILCAGDGSINHAIELFHFTDEEYLKEKDLVFLSNYKWEHKEKIPSITDSTF